MLLVRPLGHPSYSARQSTMSACLHEQRFDGLTQVAVVLAALLVIRGERRPPQRLRADRRYRKPVLNTESGYEYLRGGPTERQQVHHTDKVRRASWRIVCAGGYLAAGFNGTIGHSDVWNRRDAPNRYTFQVRDEGAAAQLRALSEFFPALPFWRPQP